MPGTKKSGRAGGNPGLVEYQFQTDRSEPLVGKLTLRVAPSELQKLKKISNWQEKVRSKISELLLEIS